MLDLASTIIGKYNGFIDAYVTSTGEIIGNDNMIVNYTFYLLFKRRDDYIYPLFTATCKLKNGMQLNHCSIYYGPPTPYGDVVDEDNFKKVIEDILKESRTRNVILSLY